MLNNCFLKKIFAVDDLAPFISVGALGTVLHSCEGWKKGGDRNRNGLVKCATLSLLDSFFL